MNHAYERSALYREKWDDSGVKPRDIRSFGDFEQISTLIKEEIRQDQKEHPPFDSNLCVPLIVITREKAMDEMIVQTEYQKGVVPEAMPMLKMRIEREFKSHGLRSVVQMVEPDQLERTEFKARRVIDKRTLMISS